MKHRKMVDHPKLFHVPTIGEETLRRIRERIALSQGGGNTVHVKMIGIKNHIKQAR